MKSYFLNKKNVLALATMVAVVSLGLFYYYAFASPDTPITNPVSEFQICASNVAQPACYDTSRPTPTFNWTFNSSDSDPNDGLPAATQVSYWVGADNDGSIVDGNFPSPEINTGEVSSSANNFTAPNDASNSLVFNVSYKWKVAVKDSYNTWSGWTCADVEFTTNGICNSPPTATSLSVVKGNYCTIPSHYFSWTYSDPDGDTESRYDFQVDNNSDFSSLEVDITVNSPGSNNQTVIVAVSPGSNQITYNTTYYWRVKVYDTITDSGWVDGTSFTTDKHEYPTIDFSWLPTNPSIDESTIFTDLSTVFGGSTKSAWSWTFENGNPASSAIQNIITKFTSTGSKQVTLQVTDSDTYSCSESKTINIQDALPEWEEN